jgi:RNA recognition motif-containing protein
MIIRQNTNPTIDAIKENGRLFVRNLPYTASEDDLRELFAVYGTLEEVRANISFVISLHSMVS